MQWQRGLTRAVTILACASGLTYLLIRLTTLGSGSLLVLSLPLLAAEYVAFAQFALFAFAAWNSPHPGDSRPLVDRPFSVDLVINARLSDLSDLERTLVGARAMRSLGIVVVVDTSHRVVIGNSRDRSERNTSPTRGSMSSPRPLCSTPRRPNTTSGSMRARFLFPI